MPRELSSPESKHSLFLHLSLIGHGFVFPHHLNQSLLNALEFVCASLKI